jgi:hypothetical protein
MMFRLYVQYIRRGYIYCTEAEFVEVIGTKVLRVFSFIHCHLYTDFTPPPLSKSGLKLVYNVNNVHRNLKSEIMPRNLNEIVTS